MPVNDSKTISRLIVSMMACAMCLMLSCGKDSPVASTRPGPPAELDLVSGDAQSGTVGEELTQPLVVKVLDAEGRAVEGQVINFRVTAGGGSVFAGAASTNANGIAQERWTLGTTAGASQTLEARAIDNNTGQPLVFATFHATAVAGPPTALSVATQPATSAAVATTIVPAPTVQLMDKYGNVVRRQNVIINAAVTSSSAYQLDGNLTASTNVDGLATFTNLSVRGPAGTISLLFSSANLTSATSREIAIDFGAPATLSAATATEITGTVGQSVTTLPAVVVKDAGGNGIPGVPIQFTVGSDAGTIDPSSVTSDASGRATLKRWTLPTVAGRYALQATTASLAAVTFTATAQPAAPSSIVVRGGTGQSGAVLVPLGDSVAVRVTDQFGNPVSAVPVTWAASGNGTASPATATTDLAGLAATQWSPGRVGTNNLTATAFGKSTSTTAVGAVPATATLSIVRGNDQTATTSSGLSQPVVAKFSWQGQPVRGAPITWAITSGGGAISPSSTLTDDLGNATAFWELGPSAGTNTATASASNGAVLSFSATATSPPAVPAPTQWSSTTIPGGTYEIFEAVTGLSSTNVVAGGSSGKVVRFDGNTWNDIGPATGSRMSVIQGLWESPNGDIFAAGITVLGRYRAGSWEIQSSLGGDLYSVFGFSSSNVFAAGRFGTIEHFDGTTWTKMTVPGGTGDFRSIWGSSPSDIYAVGHGSAFIHFDGGSWPPVIGIPSGHYTGVFGRSSKDVFVVGLSGVILHYDGRGWTQMQSGVTTDLYGVGGIANGGVYAVGGNGTLLTFDGSAWTRVNAPIVNTPPPGYSLTAVWQSSTGDVFAVGAPWQIVHGAP